LIFRARGQGASGVLGALLLVSFVVGSPAPARAQTPDVEAVVAVAEGLFEAMTARDSAAMLSHMIPNSFVISMREGRLTHATGEDFAARLGTMQAVPIERMWNPQVNIDGDVAQMWAPYDVYVDGVFSHCGFDAFHLVRVEGTWKLAGVTYSVANPPACETHPDGPPR